MLFYPEEYFYEPSQQRSERSSQQPQWRSSGFSGGFNASTPSMFSQSSQGYPSRTVVMNEEPRSRHHRSHRGRNHHEHSSPFGNSSPFGQQYVVIDDDELQALRAYREAKIRDAELAERRREAALRHQEAERLARQRAEQIAQERRIRAVAEANARAAARAYIRRKQAEQIARMQAEYDEKKQRQQAVLEKLFNPSQWSNFPQVMTECGLNPHSEEHSEDNANTKKRDANREVEEDVQQGREPTEGEPSASTDRNEDPRPEDAEENARNYIRLLVDALAPTMFRVVEPSESSEDEAQSPEDEDGPHCETASETSDNNYSEIADSLSEPPSAEQGALSEEDDEKQPEKTEEPVVTEPSGTPEPAKASSSSKSPKHKRNQRNSAENVQPKKARRKSKDSSVVDSTAEETVALLNTWRVELDHIKEAEAAFAEQPTPENPDDITQQKRKVRAWCASTEKIYNNLDELKVGKDTRKLKHKLTSDAVALADKLEIWLLRLDALKPPSPKYHVTLEDVTDDESS